MTAAASQLGQIPPTLEGYIMYYVLKVVTTSPADMAHLLMVYAPWGILVGFLLARRDWPSPDEPRQLPCHPQHHPLLTPLPQPLNHPPSRKQQHPTSLMSPSPRRRREMQLGPLPTPHSLPRPPPHPLKLQLSQSSPSPLPPQSPTPRRNRWPIPLENQAKSHRQPTPLPPRAEGLHGCLKRHKGLH